MDMFWKQQHILVRLTKHLSGSIFQKIISKYSQLRYHQTIIRVTIEEMKELNANTPAEYMVLNHDHTYLTTEGIAYIRIKR